VGQPELPTDAERAIDSEIGAAVRPSTGRQAAAPDLAPLIPKRFDLRTVGIFVIAFIAVIWLLRSAQEVLIPFVLSGLLFYALDPFVDRLQAWKVPRVLGAALVLLAVVAGLSVTAFSLRDEAIALVDELPAGVRKLRSDLRAGRRQPSTLEKVREAAQELDRTAAETEGATPAPDGVVRVQVDEPAFRASEYIWSGSMGAIALFSLGVMIFFLTYFLLVANDLFKQKLVKNIGAAVSEKVITIQILDEIGTKIERFLLVQILTSAIVAVATGLALWWIGLEGAAVWGLLAGVLNSIPYAGPLVVTIGLSLVAFLQFETVGMTAAVAGVALAITTAEGWILTPTLLGHAAQMNRIAVFAGLLFWTWMWGAWGTLLAIPMMMVIKVVCDHVETLRPVGDFMGE
jgi:predicted PurR-regulated permease PerM